MIYGDKIELIRVVHNGSASLYDNAGGGGVELGFEINSTVWLPNSRLDNCDYTKCNYENCNQVQMWDDMGMYSCV